MEIDNEFRQTLIRKLQSYDIPMSIDVMKEGLRLFKIDFMPAGSLLATAGTPCNKIFFTQSSIVRCFHLDECGEEKTDWIEPEQSFVTDFITLSSNNTPSGVSLYMYEDSNVLSISKADLQELFSKHHEWALLGTKIMSESIEYSLKIADIFLKSNAEERYRYIEEHYPRFLQVVPLHHIASRLSLSPVTISRIRAKKRN